MGVLPSFVAALGLVYLVFVVSTETSYARLSTNFYAHSCPHLLPTVRSVVRCAIEKEARMGASLLRLHFHDCFVNGCDASNLLDDTPSLQGEKNVKPNAGSLRGFEVIDQIKEAVEQICPDIVSCADILTIAARDSVSILGGPNWQVKLGRRDARTANVTDVNPNNLPPPNSTADHLISSFHNHGLSIKDLVALYGGHTIGKARCFHFRAHIYNDTDIDPSLRHSLQAICPSTKGVDDNTTAPLDPRTPNSFDNAYFKGLGHKLAILHSDQELFNAKATNHLIRRYSTHLHAFRSDFAAAMIKMGHIKVLTGSSGEIRRNCRRANS